MLTMQNVASGAWCHPHYVRWIQMVRVSKAQAGTTILSKPKSHWKIFLLNIKSRYKYFSAKVKVRKPGKVKTLHYFCHKEINLTKANNIFRVSVTKKRSLSKEFANCFEESWQSALLRLQGFILPGLFWNKTTRNALFITRWGGIFKSKGHCSWINGSLNHWNDWC